MPDMDNVTKSRFSFEGPSDRKSDCQSKALLFADGELPGDSGGRLPIAETIYTIETEVIPRLLISARTPHARTSRNGTLPFPSTAPKPEPRLEAEVAILTQIVLLDEAPAACTFISSLRERGVGLESVFLDLLAPTARRLGEMWVEDRCTFSEVTLGLCRLQQVLRHLGNVFDEEIEPLPTVSSVLLTPIPGEQHTFGLLMLDEFYRRSGWDTVLLMPGGTGEICAAVAHDWFSAAGISASCSFSHDGLRALIGDMRRSSRNPSIAILVGGRAFGADAELARSLGADGTAVDGRDAIVQTHRLVGDTRRSGDRRSG